ncbi:2-dehydro-3-deoxygalactonokinase [Fodinibius salsisoli]|uniref:2-dehydro-3-deoxygalactonokinase n=1 Tax=Fodinibius salsisoli TaxID=2820877 RepID=A0ABT3PQJ6_9BACT|nr:2-dehydro-3-deoxygalactonokinase [Fodinibius salsisoli]MCW9708134.1 2-dehydro-3-deoxygalactonokinase [Fodinibius salsisoli]
MVAPVLDNENKHSTRHFLSCDWGTSSFRLRLVNINTGKTIARLSNSFGIKKIHDQWLEVESNRIDYYQSFLKQQIDELKKESGPNTDRLPLVISGMASSSMGIQELPYSNLPFQLDYPNLHIKTLESTSQFPYRTYLVSGLCTQSDVMRGEETELVGLFATLDIERGCYILAGTHSKHVWVKDKAVTDFKTYMTGELFDLLLSKSILSQSVKQHSKTDPGPAFTKGVNACSNENLLHNLFSIRAHDILNQTNPTDSIDYLSGLLIGTELKDLDQKQIGTIVLAGNQRLQKYYAKALDFLKLRYTQADPSVSDNIISRAHSIILNQQN